MKEVREQQQQQGMYRPEFEHDNCGIGAVVNIKGKKTHDTVANALKIVEHLEHRAGKDAEGKTGDGVGILLQISHKFFKRVCKKEGFDIGGEREYGVAQLFFPQQEIKRAQAKKMFEIIGLSYYPFWHGSLQMLNDNMNDIAERYGKDLVIAEVSMGYTMEDYKNYEKLSDEERKGYATRPALVEKIEYPMTKQGQYDFMEDFLNRISHIKGGKGKGFFYWEPAWIPVPGSGWATPASLKYMNDPGPCGNEWANQALFDYDGNALPTLSLIRDFKPEV